MSEQKPNKMMVDVDTLVSTIEELIDTLKHNEAKRCDTLVLAEEEFEQKKVDFFEFLHEEDIVHEYNVHLRDQASRGLKKIKKLKRWWKNTVDYVTVSIEDGVMVFNRNDSAAWCVVTAFEVWYNNLEEDRDVDKPVFPTLGKLLAFKSSCGFEDSLHSIKSVLDIARMLSEDKVDWYQLPFNLNLLQEHVQLVSVDSEESPGCFEVIT